MLSQPCKEWKAKIELFDGKTGEQLNEIREENMITNAVDNILNPPDYIESGMDSENDRSYNPLRIFKSNIADTAFHGVIVCRDKIEENADNVMLPWTNAEIGHAGIPTTNTDYGTIANAVGLKKDTIDAFCRKIGLTGTKAHGNDRITLNAGFCLRCGNLLHQTHGRKKVKFCSDKCRTVWWNSHPEAVNRKAVYSFTCAHCGKSFTAYGNAGRKYCSHACYIADRYKGGDEHE